MFSVALGTSWPENGRYYSETINSLVYFAVLSTPEALLYINHVDDVWMCDGDCDCIINTTENVRL